MLFDQIKVRVVWSTIALLAGMNCLVIGNLIDQTVVMSLGIICVPTSIILLNPLAQKLIKWVDEISED